ncbi:LPS export ABC transporter permease LptF [Noviherbaspirillum cavernae]|uniref:Lipopolysaccharide export system permease protein LptF n=1 Tax=Noviherbaspirillum cavernae TaxID=2320862 RepID=A0A418WZH2_9BURK|nr:LPS export ABC transporter permease LptF [Noviherbaspirillum cavernae]RJG05602.1 LPS export ABC transporter permease LptF [Noviherbaspirillum cavernae]
MIFQRALRRELVSTAGAVFTTLFTITITIMLIRILGQAAGGRVASQDVIALIGFAALNYLPIILILTGFISVLLVITRSYRDSEMVVWFSSGLSLARWVKPVLMFSLPIVVLTAVLSFYVTPWANRQSAEYKERFQKRDDISKVSPGKFQESARADRIFFVEAIAGDEAKVQNIFVNSVKDGRSSVVVAKEGTIEIDSRGDKFLVMSKGRRYDGMPSEPDFRMMEFQRYGVLVAQQAAALVGDTSARSLPTTLLVANPNNFNKGELLWRLSLPLMCLLLIVLAIPLGFVNPRAGRSGNLMVALLLAVVYSNMVSVFQAAVVQGRMPLHLAWWPIHLFAVLMIMLLFSWRLAVNSPYHPASMWGAFKRACMPKKASAQ